jgi:hypothetical protein
MAVSSGILPVLGIPFFAGPASDKMKQLRSGESREFTF